MSAISVFEYFDNLLYCGESDTVAKDCETFVRREDHEREMAALYEELDGQIKLNTYACISIGQIQNTAHCLLKRLAIAEERNSEMSELLSDSLHSVYDDANSCETEQDHKEVMALAKRIKAAINTDQLEQANEQGNRNFA